MLHTEGYLIIVHTGTEHGGILDELLRTLYLPYLLPSHLPYRIAPHARKRKHDDHKKRQASLMALLQDISLLRIFGAEQRIAVLQGLQPVNGGFEGSRRRAFRR